jgi:superfamily II DNA or RNA helicase
MRDYQLESSNVALEQRRGVLWLSTNSGKSSCIAAIAGRIARETKRGVLVIVPTGLLLSQTSKEISELLGPDVRVSVAGDGKLPKRTPDILVGTYQTLALACRKPKSDGATLVNAFVMRCLAVLVDEAHHVSADSYRIILEHAVDAQYRLGFTGSAELRDLTKTAKEDVKATYCKALMFARLGPILYRVSNQELIDRGISAKPHIFLICDRNGCGRDVSVSISPGKKDDEARRENIYQQVFNKAIISDVKFNETCVRVSRWFLENGRPPIVFSHSIRHLKVMGLIAERLRLNYAIISGDDTIDRREKVLRQYAESPDMIVFTSSILDEGVSVPAIKSIVFAGARKIVREMLQRVGRGLRRKEGDNTVWIADIAPLHASMLLRHFDGRHRGYELEGFDITTVHHASTLAELRETALPGAQDAE